MLTVKRTAGRRNYLPSRARKAGLKERALSLRDAFWALMIPVGIVGGLRFGVFTPTEAGAAAALYAALIGFLVYRELDWRKLPQIVLETVLLTSVVMLIIAAANGFGFYMAWQQIPPKAAEAMLELTRDPIVLLLIINVFLLIIGMFIDGAAALVLLTPLLAPIIPTYGIDPVHFGIIFMLNLEIGAVTPPLGVVMYTVVSIIGVPLERYVAEALPLIGALIAVLLLVTFIPALSLTLPNLLF